jgi:hypothetical protein
MAPVAENNGRLTPAARLKTLRNAVRASHAIPLVRNEVPNTPTTMEL